MSVRLELSLAPNSPRHVQIRAVGTLGPTAFRAYDAALRDRAFYVPAVKSKCLRIETLGVALKALREAVTENGASIFDVHVASEVFAAEVKVGADEWMDRHAVDDRIEAIARISKEQGFGEGLFPYQVIGTRELAISDKKLLADDMGLGKTLQAIAAIPTSVPVLVVCPSAVKGEWRGQISQWRPQVRTTVLAGRNSFRWPEPGEMVIVNFDILPNVHDSKVCDGFLPGAPCPGCLTQRVHQLTNVVDAKIPGKHKSECKGTIKKRPPCPGCHKLLTEAPEGLVVVIDECHFVKNDEAIRTRAMKAIGESARKAHGRNWGLTGTPLDNSPEELWTVLDVLGLAEQAFGSKKQFYAFFKAERHASGYGTVFHLPDPDTMKERLGGVMLRRLKAEVLRDLPEKLYSPVTVDVSAQAIQACESLVSKYGSVDKIIELISADKFPFEMMSAARAALATAKIPALLEYVEHHEKTRTDDPLVVFSAHTGPVKALGQRKGWAVVTGEESFEKKRKAIDAFQAGELKGIALTIRAGGTGIQLVKASKLVFVDRDFAPGKNAQAEDRIHRIGQTRGVLIVDLVATHKLDKRLYEILGGKRAMIQATVDAAASPGESPTATASWFQEKTEIDAALDEGSLRGAETDVEREQMAKLPFARWESASAKTVALELIEQFDTIGLTPAGWALVAKLMAVALPEELSKAEETQEKAAGDAGSSGVEKKTKSLDEPKELAHNSPSPPVTAALRLVKPRKLPGERNTTPDESTPKKEPLTMPSEEKPGEQNTRALKRQTVRAARADLDKVVDAVENAATPAIRVALFDELRDTLDELAEDFCPDCGDVQHDGDEKCPADDGEGEEEDQGGQGRPGDEEEEPESGEKGGLRVRRRT